MEDEFTKEMHSTLYISERTRKKLDAGSFWKIVGFNASESEVKEFCKKYEKDGVIWFLESCDLTPISITRSLWQLQNAGWFDTAKGFLIGRPLHIKDLSFGIDCKEAAIRILKKHNVPILLDIDLGHLPPQMPFVSGAIGNITAEGNALSASFLYR